MKAIDKSNKLLINWSKYGISHSHVIYIHIYSSHWHSIVVYMQSDCQTSSLTVPSGNPSRSGGFHCGLCSAKEMPVAFIGVHEPGDGGHIQSIRPILVDILALCCWGAAETE